MEHKLEDAAATKEIKKENMQSVRTVLNDSPSQRLSISSSLNTMNVKL
jgi:hypothetical protein